LHICEHVQRNIIRYLHPNKKFDTRIEEYFPQRNEFSLQGRTTMKVHFFLTCLCLVLLWEGGIDFHSWVGSKITHECLVIIQNASLNKSKAFCAVN
jgi:hypothetical protein